MKRLYLKPDIVTESMEAVSAACCCHGKAKDSFIMDAVNHWGGLTC